MKAALLVLVLSLGTPALAADPRAVTLDDAVELALRTDPAVDAAYIDRDRTKNATLRTQLDRITLRIDGQLQELWNKSNIGGPTLGELADRLTLHRSSVQRALDRIERLAELAPK